MEKDYGLAKDWLKRPQEIVEIETYSYCVVVHLTGGRRVEIQAIDPSEDLEFYIRGEEDK